MNVFNFFLGRISKTGKAIWSVLLRILTTSGLLTNLLQILVTQNSRIAALWVLELCVVVYKISNKNDRKHNENDCMNYKALNLDTGLILRTALNEPHTFTILFLKWSVFYDLK